MRKSSRLSSPRPVSGFMSRDWIFRQLRDFNPPVPIEQARAVAEKYGLAGVTKPEAVKAIERAVRQEKIKFEQRLFRLWCRQNGLPLPVFEHCFARPERNYRFDIAWVEAKLAIEVNGGIWRKGGGAHQGTGHVRDMEKLNLAQGLTWVVLQYEPKDVRGARMLDDVKRALTLTTERTP